MFALLQKAGSRGAKLSCRRRIMAAMPRLLGHTLLLTIFLCAGCASSGPATQSPVERSVLLVSLDGLRASDLDLGITPTLSRLAREGVRAEWMTPAYPSLTFPNHYTIVTGLRPDRHGIVHNTIRDEMLGGFKLSDREAVGNGDWWQGEPIWVGAEKAGLSTATLFWPGSEAPINNVRPQRWKPFDKHMPLDARVETVRGWLLEPPATRPRFATMYFETVDEVGHAHGPDSAQARAAIRAVDAALALLIDGLAAGGRLDQVDLIIVSDHGMAAVAPGHVIAVEDMVSMEDAEVVTVGQSIGIAPRPGREAMVERKLLGRHDHYDCWRKQELPARWRYGAHPRVPPIVCQMHEGWDALPRAIAAKRPKDATRGSHGYDPALPSMRAVFIARGPSFRNGVRLPAFDNIDVYPLLAHLLGIVPAPNDGDAATLLPALRP